MVQRHEAAQSWMGEMKKTVIRGQGSGVRKSMPPTDYRLLTTVY
jgi:hypothetical protein